MAKSNIQRGNDPGCRHCNGTRQHGKSGRKACKAYMNGFGKKGKKKGG